MTTVAQDTALAAPAARTVYFLEMQFRSATQRVSSMNINYTWGGFQWQGLGALGSVDSIQEANSLDTKALNFGLNAADLSWLALAIGDVEDYCGQPAKLYFCPLDENFQLIDTPEICWRGVMDLITVGVDAGGKGKINLKCETTAYSLKRVNSLRMNAAQQKKRHPSDTGFDYLTGLISQPQLWLSKKFQSQ